MSQTIHCQSCNADSVARGVADLIDRHTNEKGRFCCARCGGTDTFLETQALPRAGKRKTWFRGIVPIHTQTTDSAYAPFVFLTAEEPDGEITGIAFRYYCPAPSNGSRPKQSQRRGGGPMLSQSQFLALVARLAKIGVVSGDDWREFVRAGAARAG